jgi:SAM-dependent methyltransferase
LVQPGGEVVGIDGSAERIAYARRTYAHPDLSFVCHNFLEPIRDLGQFDFIWIRFILEHYLKESAAIVQIAHEVLKPGGVLCLIDLDHNSLNHHELPPTLSLALSGLMERLQKVENFDPFAGRKLYAYLYDLKMSHIKVDMRPHNLIYGDLKEVDRFNWGQKIFAVAKKSKFFFDQYYDDGVDGFLEDFNRYFSSSRRFSYTPMILCRGEKTNF